MFLAGNTVDLLRFWLCELACSFFRLRRSDIISGLHAVSPCHSILWGLTHIWVTPWLPMFFFSRYVLLLLYLPVAQILLDAPISVITPAGLPSHNPRSFSYSLLFGRYCVLNLPSLRHKHGPLCPRRCTSSFTPRLGISKHVLRYLRVTLKVLLVWSEVQSTCCQSLSQF